MSNFRLFILCFSLRSPKLLNKEKSDVVYLFIDIKFLIGFTLSNIHVKQEVQLIVLSVRTTFTHCCALIIVSKRSIIKLRHAYQMKRYKHNKLHVFSQVSQREREGESARPTERALVSSRMTVGTNGTSYWSSVQLVQLVVYLDGLKGRWTNGNFPRANDPYLLINFF